MKSHPSGAVGFVVDRSCIPVGVRCLACGKLHLPGRLLRRVTAQWDARTVELHCPNCEVSRSLDRDHLQDGDDELLDLLRAQLPRGRSVCADDVGETASRQ